MTQVVHLHGLRVHDVLWLDFFAVLIDAYIKCIHIMHWVI